MLCRGRGGVPSATAAGSACCAFTVRQNKILNYLLKQFYVIIENGKATTPTDSLILDKSTMILSEHIHNGIGILPTKRMYEDTEVATEVCRYVKR